MVAKYINPYTDFGFKKLFGEEASKPLLMDFLNSMLPEYHQIKTLSFHNTEQLGASDDDRKAIYDIYCENELGEKFIIELQKVRQKHFKERTLYYTTYPIREQGEKGDWNYSLKAVYCIAVLNFTFDDFLAAPACHEVVHTVQLKDQNNRVFYDKLTFIYLEMPNFDKKEHELKTQLDKWLYFIKNLEDIQQIPHIFNDDVFTKAFATAELAKLDRGNRTQYEHSLKQYRDLQSAMETYREEGRAEGIEAGIEIGIEQNKRAIAKQLKMMGLSVEQIQQATGLSSTEIEQIK
ncbi:MAG: Rpn family recombination-promoting nuclease/putative transposase [Acinetobacter sp.]|nr:Rpn family recombination-promoting nuclease/putative transposase [Acinetobacter sp.]